MAESAIPSTGGGAPGASGHESATGDGAAGAHPNINVQQLADKVYSLLLADARLSRRRGEATPRPTRKGEA